MFLSYFSEVLLEKKKLKVNCRKCFNNLLNIMFILQVDTESPTKLLRLGTFVLLKLIRIRYFRFWRWYVYWLFHKSILFILCCCASLLSLPNLAWIALIYHISYKKDEFRLAVLPYFSFILLNCRIILRSITFSLLQLSPLALIIFFFGRRTHLVFYGHIFKVCSSV